MEIRDIFENQIDRHIDPVVEIGGETDASRKNELVEFVVTQQVKKHLKDFLSIILILQRQEEETSVSGFLASLEVVNLIL